MDLELELDKKLHERFELELCGELRKKPEIGEELEDNFNEISWTKEVLKNISNRWESRASVRNRRFEEEEIFVQHKKDFLAELLPFKDQPIFTNASDEEKDNILTCGWLIYNQKTIELENFVLTPVCMDIYNEVFPGVDNNICKEVASETLVDESYHTLLTLRASQITKKYRGRENLRIPTSNLLPNIRKLQSEYQEKWQKSTILLAAAIVTEIFVGGHLSSIARADNIQPLNILTTKAHMMDELVHSCIFKGMTKLIYSAMSRVEREFFAHVLPYPVYWLVDEDIALWDDLLYQFKFTGREKLIKEYKANQEGHMSKANFSDVYELSEELGVSNMENRIQECVDRLSKQAKNNINHRILAKVGKLDHLY